MIHGFLLRVDTVPSGNFKATYLKILYDSSPSVKNNRPGSLVRTVEGPGLGLLGIGDQIFGLQQQRDFQLDLMLCFHVSALRRAGSVFCECFCVLAYEFLSHCEKGVS